MSARHVLRSCVVVGLAGAVGSVAWGGPTLTNVGVLPGVSGGTSYAMAISADGSVVVGYSGTATAVRAFRWSEAEGIQSIGSLIAGGNSVAYDVSPDGSVITGSALSPFGVNVVFRWTAVGGMQGVDTPSGLWFYTEGEAVSASGSRIAGTAGLASGDRAFRWTQGSGIQELGTLAGGQNSYGYAISADGACVTGFSQSSAGYRAFRWTEGTGMVSLGTLPGTVESYAADVSFDGSAIAGYGAANNAFRAFRWTAAGLQDLGTPPGSGLNNVAALAISGDGATVGGTGSITFNPSFRNRAVVWNSAFGMVDLNVYLPTLGVDLTGWVLNGVSGISYDGRTVVGSGTFNGQQRAFVVRGLEVATACYANCDGSSQVPVLAPADFSCFLAKFRAGDAYANCDQSTTAPVLTPTDFSCFLDRFRGGC